MAKKDLYAKLEKIFSKCSSDYIYDDMDEFDELFTKEFGEDNATYVTFEPESDTYDAEDAAIEYVETCISLQNRGKKITAVASEFLGDVLVTVISFE